MSAFYIIFSLACLVGHILTWIIMSTKVSDQISYKEYLIQKSDENNFAAWREIEEVLQKHFPSCYSEGKAVEIRRPQE